MATENPIITEMKKRGSLGTQTGDVDPSDGSDEYQQLRQQDFKALLDSQIQLSAARQNSMKQTQSQINASGFGSTGYGSMAQSSINNSFINALQSAKNNYQTQEQSIANQEQTANEADTTTDYQAFTSLLNNATSADEINDVLSNYKYGTVDDDGAITWDTSKLKDAGYTDAEIKELTTIGALKTTGLSDTTFFKNYTASGSSDSTAYGSGDASALKSAITTTENHDGAWVGNEVDYAASHLDSFTDGQVVKLQRSTNPNEYAFIVKHNGKWYVSTESAYNKAKSKATVSEKSIIANTNGK